jgi:hypothetical protein
LKHLTTRNKSTKANTEVVTLIFSKPYYNKTKIHKWMNKHYHSTCYNIKEYEKTLQLKVANLTKEEEKKLFREFRTMVTNGGVKMRLGIRRSAPLLTKKQK